MSIRSIDEIFGNDGIQKKLYRMYGKDKQCIQNQRDRYRTILMGFKSQFRGFPDYFFSAPGRVEIGGNHTDHNGGCVIAASVDLDAIAAVKPNSNHYIKVFSEGYSTDIISVDIRDLSVREMERNQTSALIRGIVARFEQLGYQASGFNAYISSNVIMGSGLSSSASFEVLIGTILNTLFNKGAVSDVEIAQIGQYSENEYFGKPCGLMDQMASSLGGIVLIDFKDKTNPLYEKVDIDFESKGYGLLIVNTKGNHRDFTEDYAAIPKEMKLVCREFGVKRLREIEAKAFFEKIPALRNVVGDRALLRCAHFFMENERVAKMKVALEEDDFSGFLSLINESGQSSFCWLQNCYSPAYPENQGISLGLFLTRDYFAKRKIQGACRVHGGGFAGSYEVFLPNSFFEDYQQLIESVFGKDAVKSLKIRSIGANCVYPSSGSADLLRMYRKC